MGPGGPSVGGELRVFRAEGKEPAQRERMRAEAGQGESGGGLEPAQREDRCSATTGGQEEGRVKPAAGARLQLPGDTSPALSVWL